MLISSTRLDRYISQTTPIKRRDVRALLAAGRIIVDGQPALAINQVVDRFNHVVLDGEVLQAERACYMMLNKPAGIVSATIDDQHKTVIDLIDSDRRDQLHLVGRLDFNSTGLILLTNDGRWSRRLTEPTTKVMKWYRVTLEKPLNEEYVTAFREGMYFPFEGITTRPALLRVISDRVAQVGLVEGRYHQIKRMFGRFQNTVLALHRFAIGDLQLDEQLALGESRELTAEELNRLT